MDTPPPSSPADLEAAETTSQQPQSSIDSRFLNLLASALAVFVSMVSLFLAYSSNRTQERMLAAASWPYLSYVRGNSDGVGGETVFLEIRNAGSGPAVLHWVVVRGEGHALIDGPGVLRWAAPAENGLPSWSLSTTGLPLPPGEGTRFFRYARDQGRPEAWAAVERARWQIVVEGCYCSIIDDCWRFGESSQPTPVDRCGPAPKDAWNPK